MQRRLAGADLVIQEAADHFVDFRQAAVNGLEHFQGVLMGDIERALDLAIGVVARRIPGDDGGYAEQCQRKGQRSGHHPLQQSQRITLRVLHDPSRLSIARVYVNPACPQGWRSSSIHWLEPAGTRPGPANVKRG